MKILSRSFLNKRATKELIDKLKEAKEAGYTGASALIRKIQPRLVNDDRLRLRSV